MKGLSRFLLLCLMGGALATGGFGCRHPTITPAAAGPTWFNIKDSGAVGDGQTVNTAAIQQAIDACAGKGGGAVVIPAGRYVTGTIFLKDGVTLHLDANAVLLGSPRGSDYTRVDDFKDGNGTERGYCLVGVAGASDVVIEGDGTMDGNADHFDKLALARQPFLVRCVRSRNIQVHVVHLQNPGAWTLSFFQCSNVDVGGLTIRTPAMAIRDGIDVDSCQDVQISSCDIDSGDDCICLKSTSEGATRNVVIDGCTLKSGYGGFKIGSETYGDIDNIVFRDCKILGAHGGIKIFSVDGSNISNVGVYKITMDNVTVPIMVRLGSRLSTFRAGQKARPVGSIKGVHVMDVTATNSHQIGVLLSGIPNYPIDSVDLRLVTIQLDGGGTADEGDIYFPEDESGFPDTDMFGTVMPVYGLYARHVTTLALAGLHLTPKAPDGRKALFFEDCQPFNPTQPKQ